LRSVDPPAASTALGFLPGNFPSAVEDSPIKTATPLRQSGGTAQSQADRPSIDDEMFAQKAVAPNSKSPTRAQPQTLSGANARAQANAVRPAEVAGTSVQIVAQSPSKARTIAAGTRVANLEAAAGTDSPLRLRVEP